MFQQYRSMLLYRGLLALMVLIGCAPEITTPKYTTEPNWTAENPLASRGASAGSSESYRELPFLLASTLCKKEKARRHRHRVPLKTFILNLTDTSYGRMRATLSTRMRSGSRNIRRFEWRSRDTAMSAVPTSTIWDWARSEHRQPGII